MVEPEQVPELVVPAVVPGDSAWEAGEEHAFAQLADLAQHDASAHPEPEHHAGLLRPIQHTEEIIAEDRRESDLAEAAFEQEIEHELATGEIHPPAGGPLTPEEIHEVEMHPWPGHSMEEAVARLREGTPTA